ncbi:tetratricopeptide repeat protein [Sediminicola sp. 1XM1-17]|uniref:tetratricopeptide repeat protein n=1 Tax=Sediminicola sp. 1XM1-17 TaxID=3127702 RepID=UPI003076BEF5
MKQLIVLIIGLVSFNAGAQSSALQKADSLYRIGNYIPAINYYAAVGTIAAQIQIANAYNAIGNYDKAIDSYKAVVDKNEAQVLAKFELGKLYLKTNQFLEALKVFQRLNIDRGNNPEFLYYEGRAWQELDSIESANKKFRRAVDLDSTHLRSTYQLGKHYLQQRKLDSVLYYVDHGLVFYENDVSLLNLKGLAYFNANKGYLALPIYEQLLELGENTTYVYEKLGVLYGLLYENERSKMAYQSFIELEPTNPKALYGLGNAYAKLKVLDSAAIYIKEAIVQQQIKLDKEYNALARIAVDQGDLKSAIAYYKDALQEDPEGYLYKYEICFLMDQFYKDPKMKLGCYSNYMETFGKKKDYFSEFAQRRINELREEIHFEK